MFVCSTGQKLCSEILIEQTVIKGNKGNCFKFNTVLIWIGNISFTGQLRNSVGLERKQLKWEIKLYLNKCAGISERHKLLIQLLFIFMQHKKPNNFISQ